MANSIALFREYLPLLDEVYRAACLSSVLDGAEELAAEGANAGELVIPKISMSGLADYSRSSGYQAGDVTLTNETVTCNYDRGRMFTVDRLDDAETAGVAFGRLAGEFIRTKVAPELDAFRFARYASAPAIGSASGSLASGANVVSALRTAHSEMDEAEVPLEGRVLFITSALKGMVDDLDTTRSRAVMGLCEQVIVVPQTRFYTAVTLGGDGYSRRAASGDDPAGALINFLLVHRSAVIQFQKHVSPKIVTPEMNQDADAWKFGYRTVGIADVYENKAAGIYCHSQA
ncbi:MAG: hypothetical protein IJH78_03115 [Clostridia bacterium]|nr:hypothetical protein [Clostridia bacterium]